MKVLKDTLKNKQYHLLIETNIDTLEFPFIAKNCFTNDYTIVTRVQQINCELIGYLHKDIIDKKLSRINKKRLKRNSKFKQTKETIINDIKEVVNVCNGKIRFTNTKTVWTNNYYFDSHKNAVKWELISENSLIKLMLDMNTIFIYGFGSNQF